MNGDTFLRPDEAATFLRQHFGFGAKRSLAKLRCVGGGPTFRRAERLILYRPADLLDWGSSKISEPLSSTSATGRSRS